MTYELVYDIAASTAPASSLWLGVGVMTVVVVWGGWLKRWRRVPLHAGVKFLGAIAALLLALSLGYRVEQLVLASRTDAQTVEGPVTDYWTQRVRRAGSGRPSYSEWEGFRVGGVPFAYARNVEQNYFHNAGSFDLRRRVRLRVRYVSDREGRNQILRVEREIGAQSP